MKPEDINKYFLSFSQEKNIYRRFVYVDGCLAFNIIIPEDQIIKEKSLSDSEILYSFFNNDSTKILWEDYKRHFKVGSHEAILLNNMTIIINSC